MAIACLDKDCGQNLNHSIYSIFTIKESLTVVLITITEDIDALGTFG